MIPYIIIAISIIFDGLLTNYLPYLENNLSLFTPLLTLVSLFIIYPFYQKQEKKYYITVFIIGLIYDLLYTNLYFTNGVLFLLIASISVKIQKVFPLDILKIIIYAIILVTLYEISYGLVLFIFNMVPVTIHELLYKILHSLILNIIYMELIYLVIKIIPKKYKKISIN